MWILMWLALTSSGNMEYYHLGTYQKKDECVKELSKAAVLKTNKSQTLDCIWIKLDDTFIRLKPTK